jgi:hypothetical protein
MNLEEPKPKKRAPRKTAKKAAASDPVAAPVETEQPVEPIILDGSKVMDADEKYVTIYIDEESGQPNYVPVGHNGTVFQIMRGVDVKVPVKVVDVLKDAIAHRIVQVVNPHTGNKESVMRPYNAVPFRIINSN